MRAQRFVLACPVAIIALWASPASAQPYGWGAREPEPRYVRPFRPWDDAPPVWRERAAPPSWSEDRGWASPGRDRVWREDLDEPSRRLPPHATPFAPYERPRAGEEPPSASLRDGGPRPPIAPQSPQIVPFNGPWAPGTVVIDTSGRQLLLVTSQRAALRYPISVGRDGFQWTGTEKISRIAEWPDWHPPVDMRKRDPALPEKMTGGIRNPLGAMALYLGNTLYRIHGTNDARTVGHASSSGCFRMLNGHVVDLAQRVKVGSTVVVVERLPRGTIDQRWREPPVSYDRPRSRFFE